jgi:hypothetical protein
MISNLESLESHLLTLSREYSYPKTPDIALQVSRRLRETSGQMERRRQKLNLRKWALAGSILVLIVLASAVAVPPVRAALIEFLQIGVIRIFISEPTLSPPSTQAPALHTSTAPSPTQSSEASPIPAAIVSLESIAGETTLENAIAQADFPLRLPGYPADLGEPDRVFTQDANGVMVILVWTDPGSPERAELILFQIPPGSWAGEKWAPVRIEEARVGGSDAIWAEGPYALRLVNGDLDFRRVVSGHSLLWQERGITYRLESGLSKEEAIEIAESLQPIP